MVNFVKLKCYNPFVDLYAFVDRVEPIFPSILNKHNVKFKYKNEMGNDKFSDYRIVFGYVPKRYSRKMKDLFCELNNKMLLFGYDGYTDIIDVFSKQLEK